MAYLYRFFYCFLKVLCVGVEINWFPRILDISMKLYLSILVKFNLSLVFCQLTWFPTSNQKSSLFSQLHKDHQTKQSSCILFPLFAEVSQTCLIQMCCPSFFVRLNRKLRLQIPLDFLFWVIDGLSRPGQGLRDLSPFNSRQWLGHRTFSKKKRWTIQTGWLDRATSETSHFCL